MGRCLLIDDSKRLAHFELDRIVEHSLPAHPDRMWTLAQKWPSPDKPKHFVADISSVSEIDGPVPAFHLKYNTVRR